MSKFAAVAEPLKACWVSVLNWRADRVRRVFGAGPHWRMSRTLARKLVDEGEWFMIPLFSGTQTPLFSAIQYLHEIRDYESLPRLRTLFDKYTPGMPQGERTYPVSGGMVTNYFGPVDYIPARIQSRLAEVLLAMLPEMDARRFVEDAFSATTTGALAEDTFAALIRFAFDNQMSHLAPRFMSRAKYLKSEFDTKWRRFRSYGGGISFGQLYSSQHLFYAVWRLSEDADAKNRAIDALVDEYNHPDSDESFCSRSRPYHYLFTILEDHLADEPDAQEVIRARLDQVRYANDIEKYRTSGRIRLQ